MSIRVIVRNAAGTGQDRAHIADVSAAEYVRGMVQSGFIGSADKTVEALEAGFPVIVDQFDIVIEQQAS